MSFLILPACSPRKSEAKPVVVGAKKFTESIVLAEMGTQLARRDGVNAERKDLGATPVLWEALLHGDIDAYPEYTGTITRQILKDEPADLDAALAVHGVRMSRSLGFRNNYALGMRKDVAAANGIRYLSDLRSHPELKLGFTHEFIDRADGWPGLKAKYALPHATPQGMVHTLAYRALADKAIDVTELYTTDGEIVRDDLRVLDDDLGFFPSYVAVWLYRADLEARSPQAVAALRRMEGTISEADMQKLNGTVQAKLADEPQAATAFLNERLHADVAAGTNDTLPGRLWVTTLEHLALVVPSLAAAVLVAVPLGVFASRRPRLGRVVLTATGVVQTIPSLALLLFLMPVTGWLLHQGTGVAPAVAALFLYSLLPVVRNTCTGLQSIPASLRESAAALGLPRRAILWRVELPLALPTILAGVRTAAVINVGTATLGGFIGAGGYGRPILRGLDKFDIPLMLEGAIPAAALALLVEGAFDLLERALAGKRG